MRSFAYTTTPQRIVFGTSAINRLPDELLAGSWSRVVIVTSPHYERAGVLQALSRLMGERVVGTFSKTEPHVLEAHLDSAIALAREANADAVLALGGGSPIGLAKAVSLELTVARQRADAEAAPVVNLAVPTTYAGSEMTPVYGVTRPQPNGATRKITVRDVRVPPRLVVYDPELTLDLPPGLTASTGINALAHCVESVYSATRNSLSTAAALAGVTRIARALPQCVRNGRDLDARTDMLEGAHLGGIALATVDMGIHHGTGHVLGGSAGVPHGVANCIVLPHAVRFNADVCAAELALVADALGVVRSAASDEATAHAVADRLHALVAELGQPQRLRDAGVDRDQLPSMLDALLASAAVRKNPKPLTEAAAASYLEAMW